MPDDAHSLVAPYALDALDDDDRREFEEHLAMCEQCREQLAGLREAAVSLAYGASGPTPPPELKDRILAQARSERENVTPIASRRRNWSAPLAASAAIAVAAAVALWAWGATRPAQSPLDKVLAKSGSQLVSLGRLGAVGVAPNGDAALAVSVPRAPSGKTYEAWVIRGGKAQRAGLFDGGSGTSIVRINGSVRPGSTVALTVERVGGVDQPTQKPLAAGKVE
jgi:anti-sigma-K factor RskA